MAAHEIFVRFKSNVEEFSRMLTLPQKQLNKLQDDTGRLDVASGKLNTRYKRLGAQARVMTTGFRGFRMEMLSVMFGGQMLQRSMFSLLQPALQVSGAFEIWGAMLQTLFLPIALFLLENVFLPLFDLFSGLSDPIKMVIGILVLMVGVFGAIIAVVGAVVLFIGGLILAFGAAAVIIWGVIIVAIAAIIAIIVGLVIGIIWLWKNWNKVWSWIKEKAGAAWDWIKEKTSAAWDWIVAKLNQSKIWQWIKEKASAAWQWIIDNVWTPIADWFDEWVVQPISDAWDGLVEKIKSGWDTIKGIFEKITAPIGKAVGFVKEKVLGGRQVGGYVPHTGLYKLHAGETVHQANSTFSPTINVSAGSNVDIEMLKSQLSSQWNDDLARLSRG